MAKIRHIALATNDPEKTAEFYKKAFGFEEVARTEPGNPLASGVYLSDGTLNLAVLKFKSDQLGKGMDFVGVHHFGVVVDDLQKASERIEALGADCFMGRPEGTTDEDTFFETKFHGPDGTVFDISEHPWAGSAPLDAKSGK